MKKSVLKKLIEKDFSTRAMARELECSQTNVRYWLNKYNLKKDSVKQTEEEKVKEKRKRGVIAVKKRRKKIKLMAVEYKGGKCVICTYNRCVDALEFHHEDKDGKEFGIGSKGYTRSWESIKKELDKTVLVCANCHREIECGLVEIPLSSNNK